MKKTKFYDNLSIAVLLKNRKVIGGYDRNEDLKQAVEKNEKDCDNLLLRFLTTFVGLIIRFMKLIRRFLVF